MLEKTPSVAMRSCVWRTSLVRNGWPTTSATRRRTTLSRVVSRPRIAIERTMTWSPSVTSKRTRARVLSAEGSSVYLTST